MKLLLSLIFVLCSLFSLAEASAKSRLTRKKKRGGVVYIDQSRYIAGGVISILPGFGIGHAIQGRWLEKGWVFTLVPTLSVVVGFGSKVFSRKIDRLIQIKYRDFQDDDFGNYVVAVTTLLVVIPFHIWEIVDAWVLPSNYKITSLSVAPKFYSYKDNTFVGLSLNYKW